MTSSLYSEYDPLTLLKVESATAIYGLKGQSSYSFEHPELVGIIGSNGAGKSSLLRLFCGLNMKEGQLLIAGKDFKDLDHISRAQSLSYLPQSPNLSPHWTVEEVVRQSLYPYLRSTRFNDIEGELYDLCERLGVTALLSRKISHVSGGERQRILIVRTLAQSTPITILDEPLSSLDWYTQEIVIRELRLLSQRKQRLIITSIHDLNLASIYADRLILLRDGQVLQFDTTAQVLRVDHVTQGFTSKVRSLLHPIDQCYQQLPWGNTKTTL